jgi:hypothetical protein
VSLGRLVNFLNRREHVERAVALPRLREDAETAEKKERINKINLCVLRAYFADSAVSINLIVEGH